MKNLVKVFFLLAAGALISFKANAQINVGISISARVAPPALPVYAQPECPVDGYLWVPGYWAYDNNINDYYWVPGVWVAPPQPGLLWTPAYWGFHRGVYGFHAGYWGTHIGFYGGVNYGFGYNGSGFVGGQWSGNSFRYNTAVVNVNKTVVHNTYIDRTVVVNNTTVNNRTSFNGPGGASAKPTEQERSAMKEQHVQATKQQQSHETRANKNKNQFSAANQGKPEHASMDKVDGSPFNREGKKVAHANASDVNKVPKAEERSREARPERKQAPANRPERAEAEKREKGRG